MNHDIATLQRTADYYLVHHRLRSLGRSSVVFGVFNLLASLIPIQGPFICTTLAVIGLCLLVEGFWILLSPTLQSVLFHGLVLLVVGAGELSIAVYDLVVDGRVHLLITFLGLAHVAGAIRWFRSYARFRDVMQEPPPLEDLKGMERLFHALQRSRERDPGFVQFTVPPRIWKGMLSRDLVLLADSLKQQVIVACKDDVDWTIDGTTVFGVRHMATLRVREYQFQALLSPPSFAKLADWKPAREVAEVLE
jgi:hypothetical protein